MKTIIISEFTRLENIKEALEKVGIATYKEHLDYTVPIVDVICNKKQWELLVLELDLTKAYF